MSLQTTYLGFKLKNPFVPGACPLADDLDGVRRLEDAGAPMIVLRSLFAEQITAYESRHAHEPDDHVTDASHAAGRVDSDLHGFALRPDAYVEHVNRIRNCVAETVPIVASLNVTRMDSWFPFVRLLDEAGANALELNFYSLPSDVQMTGEQIEHRIADVVRAVKRETMMPVAAKLFPYYTSLVNFAHCLKKAGADGLILFNRLYQPDIDIDNQQELPVLSLSTSAELQSRLRWLGMLHGRVELDLAATGGVHTVEDAIKAIMCGASVVQVVSVLLERGPEYLTALQTGVEQWLTAHEYATVDDIRGSMSLQYFPNPESFERGYYMHTLQSWQG